MAVWVCQLSKNIMKNPGQLRKNSIDTHSNCFYGDKKWRRISLKNIKHSTFFNPHLFKDALNCHLENGNRENITTTPNLSCSSNLTILQSTPSSPASFPGWLPSTTWTTHHLESLTQTVSLARGTSLRSLLRSAGPVPTMTSGISEITLRQNVSYPSHSMERPMTLVF